VPKNQESKIEIEQERMMTIRMMGWNFTLYAWGMIEEQKAMTFYDVVQPLSMLEI
jgi:hypothetical protein